MERTLPGGSLQPGLDLTSEYVEVRLHGGRIALLRDCKLRSIRSIVDVSVGCVP